MATLIPQNFETVSPSEADMRLALESSRQLATHKLGKRTSVRLRLDRTFPALTGRFRRDSLQASGYFGKSLLREVDRAAECRNLRRSDFAVPRMSHCDTETTRYGGCAFRPAAT